MIHGQYQWSGNELEIIGADPASLTERPNDSLEGPTVAMARVQGLGEVTVGKHSCIITDIKLSQWYWLGIFKKI
jgi:hypothetical protein